MNIKLESISSGYKSTYAIREYMMRFFLIVNILRVSAKKKNIKNIPREPTADRIVNRRNQFFTQGHRAFKFNESAKVHERHNFHKWWATNLNDRNDNNRIMINLIFYIYNIFILRMVCVADLINLKE